jgi:hypothetical protein
VFPVRYELNFYILFLKKSVLKGLIMHNAVACLTVYRPQAISHLSCDSVCNSNP